MRADDIYPDLIVTTEYQDDNVIVRLKFSNGKPGALVAVIGTIDPAYGDSRFMPSPPGNIVMRFEGSEHGYNVASSPDYQTLYKAIGEFVFQISEVINSIYDKPN